MILEGKIHRKVHTISSSFACRRAGVVGGQADGDDRGVWSHMGRREATDCRKLIVMEYSAHIYQAVCTHYVQTHASVCFPKMHYVLSDVVVCWTASVFRIVPQFFHY